MVAADPIQLTALHENVYMLARVMPMASSCAPVPNAHIVESLALCIRHDTDIFRPWGVGDDELSIAPV